VLLDRLLADAGILAASVTGPEAASHLEVAMTVACAGDTRRHAGGRIRADRIAHGNAVAQVAVYVRELTSCPSRRGGNVVSINSARAWQMPRSCSGWCGAAVSAGLS
jgi:hypothetical protein